MKRFLAVIALCLSLCLALSVTGLAAEISSVNSENLPNITVELSGVSQSIDPAAVKATLNGQPVTVNDVKAGGSVEWIVMLDTSQSVRKAYFTASQEALKSLYKSLGDNDSMQLYYFDSEIVQVLKGSESEEDALKKIDAIQYNGQETVFYDTLGKLSALAAESKADTVIPVIFTDGVNTTGKATKGDAEKSLAAMPDNFRAFYPDDLSEAEKSNFTGLMKNAKGKTVAYGTDNLANKFESVKKDNQQATLILSADSAVAANEKATLSIDLGNGKVLTKEVAVNAWEPATEPTTESASDEPTTEPTTEPVTGEHKEEKSTSPALYAVIAVVVIAAVVALLFIMKNKKKPAEGEEAGEDVKKEKKKKEPKAEETKEEEKLPKDRKERAGERAAKERDRVVKERQEAEEKAKKEQEKAEAKAAKEAEEAAAKSEAEKQKKKGAEITVSTAKEGRFDSKAAARAAKERDKVAKERQEAEYKAKLDQEKAEAKAAKEADARQEKENKKIAKQKDKNALMFSMPGDGKTDSKAAAKAAKERQKAAEKLAAEKKAAEEKANKDAAAAAKKAEPSKREQRAQRKEEQSYKFYFQEENEKGKIPKAPKE